MTAPPLMAQQERTHARVQIQVCLVPAHHSAPWGGRSSPRQLELKPDPLPHPLISPHHVNLPASCPTLPPKHLPPPPAGYPDLTQKSSPTKTDSVCPGLKEARWQSK